MLLLLLVLRLTSTKGNSRQDVGSVHGWRGSVHEGVQQSMPLNVASLKMVVFSLVALCMKPTKGAAKRRQVRVNPNCLQTCARPSSECSFIGLPPCDSSLLAFECLEHPWFVDRNPCVSMSSQRSPIEINPLFFVVATCGRAFAYGCCRRFTRQSYSLQAALWCLGKQKSSKDASGSRFGMVCSRVLQSCSRLKQPSCVKVRSDLVLAHEHYKA